MIKKRIKCNIEGKEKWSVQMYWEELSGKL